MSQRFPASCPTSLSSDDGQKNTPPSAKYRDETIQRSDQWQSSASQNRMRDQLLHPTSEFTSQRLYRTKGNFELQTMLNPTDPGGSQTSGKYYNDNFESMTSNSNRNLPIKSGLMSSSEQPLISKTRPSNESISGDSPLDLRQILISKPPNRSVSSDNMALGNTLNAQRSPASSAIQHHPCHNQGPSAGSKAAFNPNTQMTKVKNYKERYDQNYSDTKFIETPQNTSAQFPSSISTSPKSSPAVSTSPPYNQTTIPKPPLNLINQGQPISPGNVYYHPNSSFGESLPISGGIQGPLGNNEVYSITVDQGLYSIPVDVHHASRLADEKRARNAGASARFRQRRKEKEKEASLAIEKLKSQVRDTEKALEEMKSQRNFYRSERDRLRQILLRNVETRHLAMQAPPSPCTERHVSFPGQVEILSPVEPSLASSHKTTPECGSRKRRSYIEESSMQALSMAPPVKVQRAVSSGLSVNDMIQPQGYRSISVSIPPSRRWSNLPQQANPSLPSPPQRPDNYHSSQQSLGQGSAGQHYTRDRRYNPHSTQ